MARRSTELQKQLKREMRNLERRIRYAEKKWGVAIDRSKVIPQRPTKLSKSYIGKIKGISPVNMNISDIIKIVDYDEEDLQEVVPVEPEEPTENEERGPEQLPEWASIVVQGFFSQAEALRFGGAAKGMVDYASLAIDLVSADLGTYGIEAVAYALENNPSAQQEGIYITYEDIMSQINFGDWSLGYKTGLGMAVDDSSIVDAWVDNYEFQSMLNLPQATPENPEAYE